MKKIELLAFKELFTIVVTKHVWRIFSPVSPQKSSERVSSLDDQGNLVCSLGELLREHRELRTEHRELKTEHLNMKADFDSLSAAVTAQEGWMALASPPRPWCAFS